MATNYNGVPLAVFERAAAYKRIVDVMNDIESNGLYMSSAPEEEMLNDSINRQYVMINGCTERIGELEDAIRKKQELILRNQEFILWIKDCIDQARRYHNIHGTDKQ